MAVEPRRVPVVAPWEVSAVRAAGGFLPLLFRGQAPCLAGLLRQPRRIVPGVADAHHDDGVVEPALRRRPVAPGMPACPVVGMDKPIGLPGRTVDVGNAVACRRDEARVVAVGDQIARDLVGASSLAAPRALILVPFLFSRRAVAVGLFVERIGVFPLGPVGAGDERTGRNGDRLRHLDPTTCRRRAARQKARGQRQKTEMASCPPHRHAASPIVPAKVSSPDRQRGCNNPGCPKSCARRTQRA